MANRTLPSPSRWTCAALDEVSANSHSRKPSLSRQQSPSQPGRPQPCPLCRTQDGSRRRPPRLGRHDGRWAGRSRAGSSQAAALREELKGEAPGLCGPELRRGKQVGVCLSAASSALARPKAQDRLASPLREGRAAGHYKSRRAPRRAAGGGGAGTGAVAAESCSPAGPGGFSRVTAVLCGESGVSCEDVPSEAVHTEGLKICCSFGSAEGLGLAWQPRCWGGSSVAAEAVGWWPLKTCRCRSDPSRLSSSFSTMRMKYLLPALLYLSLVLLGPGGKCWSSQRGPAGLA